MEPAEVRKIVDSNRGDLFASGVTLAGRKCMVLRDNLNMDGQNTMDVKMKISEAEDDGFFFTIGRSLKALIIAKGVKGVHWPTLNSLVCTIMEHIKTNLS
ncbi:hypothetical protein DNTS_021031 [Danionella cerebrum]|uniref:Uncharacterized protein n=1 Tax=Danionella cerebrum TaxID=2873325 RepID=A0A553MU07_9TELE|nr:hypothetical protein DNTS_021031 [Danionella translucida]